MPQFLYVVAKDRPDLHDRLTTEFAREPAVRVIRDRRRDDRRRAAGTHVPERRRGERRLRRDLDWDLRSLGWFITQVDELPAGV